MTLTFFGRPCDDHHSPPLPCGRIWQLPLVVISTTPSVQCRDLLVMLRWTPCPLYQGVINGHPPPPCNVIVQPWQNPVVHISSFRIRAKLSSTVEASRLFETLSQNFRRAVRVERFVLCR